jgi:hypothetical protein
LTLDKPASALAGEEELDEKKSQHIRSIYKAKPRSLIGLHAGFLGYLFLEDKKDLDVNAKFMEL